MTTALCRFPIGFLTLLVALPAALPAAADASRVVAKPSAPAATAPHFPEGTVRAYYRGSGQDIPFALDGVLARGAYVMVRAWHNDQRRMVSEFRHRVSTGPLTITSGHLDRLPPGNVLLHLFLFLPGQHQPIDASHWISVRDGVAPPPIQGKRATRPIFPQGTPRAYRRGSGTGIRFALDGQLPLDAYVMVRAWHNDQRRMVSEFRHRVDRKPLRIEPGKLDRLPPGKVQLHLFLFLPGRHKPVNASHWIQVTNPPEVVSVPESRPPQRDPSVPAARTQSQTDPGSSVAAGDGAARGAEVGPSVRAANAESASRFLAVNVERANYWSRSWMFTDVMNQATHHYGAFRVFVDCDGHFPQGTYTVVPAHAADVVITNHVEIRPQPGFEDGDFSVYLPGFGPGQPGEGQMFHPLFLERLRPFKTVRFMLMQRTNDGQADRWDQRPRPRPGRTRRVGDGAGAEVPIEHMVDMCNAVGANPWFCMPHQADETYVRQFARLVRGRLNPRAKVYVEYSNEVWNFVFAQAKWLNRNVRGPNGAAIDHDAWAEKIKWVRDIWRSEFGEYADRVVVVLAGQESNPWHTEMLIDRLTHDGERHFDAIATSAYFSSGDTTIAEAMEDLAVRHKHRVRHGEWAKEYDVPYISYEAGQHLLPSDGAPHSIQETPEMYNAITANMRSFEEAGGSMYNAFELIGPQGHAGYWGHLRYMDQPVDEALKYKALIDYLDSSSRLQLTSFD